MTKQNERSIVDDCDVTLIYHKIVYELAREKLWLYNLFRENPLAFVQDRVVFCQFETAWELAKVCDTILLLGFDHTDNLSPIINRLDLVSLLELVNSLC